MYISRKSLYVHPAGSWGFSSCMKYAVPLFMACTKMHAHSERVFQYIHPRNIPAMKAPMACHRLRCMTAKKNALHSMALAGEVWCSSPRIIMPLKKNSSHIGAATTVVAKAQKELLRIFSNICSTYSGIGNMLLNGSVTNPSASMAAASIG